MYFFPQEGHTVAFSVISHSHSEQENI